MNIAFNDFARDALTRIERASHRQGAQHAANERAGNRLSDRYAALELLMALTEDAIGAHDRRLQRQHAGDEQAVVADLFCAFLDEVLPQWEAHLKDMEGVA